MYKGLCHNYLEEGLGYQMGAKGKITTLLREKLPGQQVLLGELRQVLNFLKGLLNFLVANSSPPHPLPPVAEKVEMTNCFLICKSQSPLARKILVCKQRQRDHRRVPNNNHIFEYSWNLV